MSVKRLTVVGIAFVVFVLGAWRMWLRNIDWESAMPTLPLHPLDRMQRFGRRDRASAEFKFRSDPRILLDIARERLQTRFSFLDALDAKVATMFAVGSALLGLLAAIFAVRPEDFDKEALIVVSIAGFYYAVLTVAALTSFWVKEYFVGPQLPAIWEDAQVKEERQFIAELVVDYRVSIDKANKRAYIKEWAARAAILAVLFLTITLGLALAVVTS